MNTCHFADSLMGEKQFEFAGKVYQRILFFDYGITFKDIFYKTGSCMENIGNYNSAIYYYQLARNSNSTDSLKSAISLNIVICYFKQNKYDQALVELYGLEKSNNQILNNRINFYLGFACFKLEDFENSKVYFSVLTDDKHDSIKEKLKVIFLKNEKLKSIKPWKAMVLSTFIPGMGQTFTGNYKEGINSLLLNCSMLVLGISTTIIYSPLDAMITVFPWFQRYYLGGIVKAGEITIQKKKIQRANLLNDVISLVE